MNVSKKIILQAFSSSLITFIHTHNLHLYWYLIYETHTRKVSNMFRANAHSNTHKQFCRMFFAFFEAFSNTEMHYILILRRHSFLPYSFNRRMNATEKKHSLSQSAFLHNINILNFNVTTAPEVCQTQLECVIIIRNYNRLHYPLVGTQHSKKMTLHIS